MNRGWAGGLVSGDGWVGLGDVFFSVDLVHLRHSVACLVGGSFMTRSADQARGGSVRQRRHADRELGSKIDSPSAPACVVCVRVRSPTSRRRHRCRAPPVRRAIVGRPPTMAKGCLRPTTPDARATSMGCARATTHLRLSVGSNNTSREGLFIPQRRPDCVNCRFGKSPHKSW